MIDNGIYKELYHYDDKHSLVMNEITHDVCFMKTLSHYDISVYQYIKDNPNKFIPRIFDIEEKDGALYVVEEYVQGSSFDSVIYSGKLTEEIKLNYFINLCYGIKYLHDAPNHIIHRDIKLSNIIIAEDGDLKIIDYDAAKIYKPGATRDTVLIGTEGMAAPEQYGFRQSDERTDIYAIGLLIKEAFPNNQRLLRIADKASAFEPNDRYQNISELIAELRPERKKLSALQKLLPPPGWRTRKWYKMLISTAFWVALFAYVVITGPYNINQPITSVIYDMFFFTCAFLTVDIIFDWTGLFNKIKFIKRGVSHLYLRRILYALYVDVMVLIIFIMLLTVSSVLYYQY